MAVDLVAELKATWAKGRDAEQRRMQFEATLNEEHEQREEAWRREPELRGIWARGRHAEAVRLEEEQRSKKQTAFDVGCWALLTIMAFAALLLLYVVLQGVAF